MVASFPVGTVVVFGSGWMGGSLLNEGADGLLVFCVFSLLRRDWLGKGKISTGEVRDFFFLAHAVESRAALTSFQ